MRLSLSDPITALGPIALRYARALHTAGISTVRDLLFYFPYRYEDWSNIMPFASLLPGIEATVQGTVTAITARRISWRRMPNAEAQITDAEGNTMRVLWFNSPFLVKSMPPGTRLLLSGKVERIKGALTLMHPQWEKTTGAPVQKSARIVPVYHLSGRLTQKVVRFLTTSALKRLPPLPDHLPPWMRKEYALADLNWSLRAQHAPKDWTVLRTAEKRLKFDELFFLQLRGALARREASRLTSAPLPFDRQAVKTFVESLPFPLTQAQRKASWEIIKDLEKPHPMNRLLEGDVGSGKTAVAAIACFHVAHGGMQAAYLAPTSILAIQHYETFCTLFKDTPVRVALLTQGDCRISPPPGEAGNNKSGTANAGKKAVHAFLVRGGIDIVIGTHALLSEKVHIPKLSLVIVDEQHRFGVRQRHTLLQKGSVGDVIESSKRELTVGKPSATHASNPLPSEGTPMRGGGKASGPLDRDAEHIARSRAIPTVPHLLTMTATPIPRSLALVAYGDLDLSVLDEMPKGRAATATRIIGPHQRNEAYALIHEELRKCRQAFIICPLIDPSDKLGVKSVKEEAERLKREHFPEATLAMLHGKMSAEKKDAVMKDFSRGAVQVLVATPVVEVGIDVPNATVILIEGAERFGLAQLHQLRGRVGRSIFASHCLLATDTESEAAIERLHAVVASHNGFALAEKDLEMRGPGESYGTTQTGFLDSLTIAKLTDAIILKQSKEAVTRLLAADSTLDWHRSIQSRLAQVEQSVHLE